MDRMLPKGEIICRIEGALVGRPIHQCEIFLAIRVAKRGYSTPLPA